jgi:hypothetical protein
VQIRRLDIHQQEPNFAEPQRLSIVLRRAPGPSLLSATFRAFDPAGLKIELRKPRVRRCAVVRLQPLPPGFTCGRWRG